MKEVDGKAVFIDDLKKLFTAAKADSFILNIETKDDVLTGMVKKALSEYEATITMSEVDVSLSAIFERFRDELVANKCSTVLVMNASMDLGWTQVLSVLIDVDGSKNLTAGQAVIAGSGNVFNGEPYIDEEIL